MIRKCFLVVDAKGREAVFLGTKIAEAEAYAAKYRGYLVRMFGKDDMVTDAEEVDHQAANTQVGSSNEPTDRALVS